MVRITLANILIIIHYKMTYVSFHPNLCFSCQ